MPYGRALFSFSSSSNPFFVLAKICSIIITCMLFPSWPVISLGTNGSITIQQVVESKDRGPWLIQKECNTNKMVHLSS